MQYMLDTDISSYLIRGDHPEVTAKFSVFHEQCVISSITAAELRYGATKRNHPPLTQKVQAFCRLLRIVPWTESAATIYAKLRNELEQSGNPIGNMDMLIASSAIAENAILVTNNVTHFSRIESLQFDNWVASPDKGA